MVVNMENMFFRRFGTNLKYISHGLPKILKELNIIEKEIEKIENTILRNTAIDSLYAAREDCICYSVFETFPSVDKKNCSKFISSIVVLSAYLKALCSRKELMGNESSIYLYTAFLDSIIIDKQPSNYYLKCPYKNDSGYLTFLVNRCRESLIELPFRNLVKVKMEDFALKFFSFYTNTYSSRTDIFDSIISWAEPKNNKTWLITCMEYSAACSNLSLLLALYTAGFNAATDDEIVKDIIYFYFPWVNSLYALMESYIYLQYLNESDNTNMNFCKRYANQKVCENRILYFYKMVNDNLQMMNNSNYHFCFIELFTSRFLYDHGAYIGINNITSRNLLQSFKHIGIPSNNFYRFIKVVGAMAAG